MEITWYFQLIIWSVFVNNFILVQFLGICPFLGVSKNRESAMGMGLAVIFVITLATLVTWVLRKYLLAPFNLGFLQTIVFILIIAALVQLVEMVVKKVSPALFQALGIFLPLITTNCAVLGTAILAIQKDFALLPAIVFAFASSVGFALVLLVFAGIRERLELESSTPKAMKGTPIALITASILSMAFLGFAGMVKI